MNKIPDCPRSLWREILSSFLLVALAAFVSAMVGRMAAASPVVSPLSLSSVESGQPVDGRMSLSLYQQNFECTGQVILGQVSRLVCGDQQQAQVEFKSYNQNRNGVMAVFQAGRQQGYLMSLERQGSSYVNTDGVLILTPGFGGINNFERYVYQPMKALWSDEIIFETLSPFMKSIGYEINISTLRDRISKKDYQSFIPTEGEKTSLRDESLNHDQTKETIEAEKEEESAISNLPEDGSLVVAEEAIIGPPVAAPPSEVIRAEEESIGLPEVVTQVPISRPEWIQENKPRTAPVARSPRAQEKKSDRKIVRITRPSGTTEYEVFDDYSSEPFSRAPKRRHTLENPRGYDLRNLSLKEIEDLERRGLIFRSKGN